MPRLAANLAYLFTERPLLARFGAAAAAGFKAVELQAPYDHAPADIRREIERYGLTMLGINTPAASGGQSGVTGVPGRKAEFAALFAKALDFAVGVGAKTIHCLTGRVPTDEVSAGERALVANLTRAADLAGESGIGLLIEPLNRRDRPENLLHLPEQAAAIIEEVARPNVRMQFDFYHVQIEAGDLVTRFKRHLPAIGHVQVAAVPSRAEPDEGEVNYPALLAAIDGCGYAGWVGCEYRPRARTEDGLGWARAYGIAVSASPGKDEC
jgi:2-dehydrotetronate isomerase